MVLHNDNNRKSGSVHLRKGFSDTTGIAPRNTIMQIEEFDDDTRIKISNKMFQMRAE